jgi:HSP20 family molecular chaperone IbpA
LPRDIDTEKIDAKYEQGVLRISLPKSVEKQPRKIDIRTGS